MNKQEIKDFAIAHGIEARYNGNYSEDNPKGFRFIPTLLNNLESCLKNQIESNQEEINSIKERIEEAKVLKAEFEQTKIYTTEAQKYETSTV